MCYMEHAKENLLRENCKPEYSFIVGSPIPEIYENIKHKVEASQILDKYDLESRDYFVWSSHRKIISIMRLI